MLKVQGKNNLQLKGVTVAPTAIFSVKSMMFTFRCGTISHVGRVNIIGQWCMEGCRKILVCFCVTGRRPWRLCFDGLLCYQLPCYS